MITRRFQQIDVFTDTAYLGNPLAVVLDGCGLSTEDMQHFAHWTNLSETTFLLPPTDAGAAQGADYRVRIFTPGRELPFAGHPTLGSCFAWLDSGGQPRERTDIMQECGVGLVRIRQDGQRLAFAAPALRRSTPEPALLAQVTAALGLAPQHVLASQLLDNGPVWLGLLLDTPDRVLNCTPDFSALKETGQIVGLAHVEHGHSTPPLIARSNREARAFGPRSANAALTEDGPGVLVRAFVSGEGYEDPVTGSFNASLAQWLIADGLAPAHYIATQGTCLGRHGQVYIDQDDQGQVWVGGASVICISGEVTL